jgi:predicted transposase/invertase (TIGR01784 family)
MPINIDLSDTPSIREAKIEIAKAMLADGLHIDQIAKFTSLTIKEIEALQTDLNSKK